MFVLFPLGMLFARIGQGEGGFTLKGVGAILFDQHQLRALWNSLLLGTLVGICGTVLGFLFAFTVSRARLHPSVVAILDAAILLPLVSPPFTTAIAMIFSFGARGIITYELLGIKGFTIYGLSSTLFSETLTFFPIAYLTLKPMLAAIDSNVESMAASLGSSRWNVFRTVTLPLATPGIANAFLLMFAASLADFRDAADPRRQHVPGAADPGLPADHRVVRPARRRDPVGRAAGACLVVFLLQRYWVSRRFYVTITGKGAGQVPFDSISPGARWPLIGVCFFVAVVVVYLYALLLYASLVVALGANHAFTLQHYKVIFTSGLQAIFDTLIIAGIAMPLGGLYGILLGYLVARKNFFGRRTMEMVSMINYALPGTIVGIAYLIAFNDPPFALAGGATIIIACYIFRYGPTGIRATIALLQQIDPSLEEASQGLGASTTTTFRRVTLPLIMPAFFAGLGVVFIRSMTAISATIFLVSISWTLITVRILENMTSCRWDRPPHSRCSSSPSCSWSSR
jgi:iron(III) transport system permease protein